MPLLAALAVLLLLAALASGGKGGTMPDGSLSPHFGWNEVSRSGTAARLGIDNTPTPEVANAARALATQVLEPLRELWGNGPVRVTSWYRSPAVNAAIPGAATNSAHMTGYAVDVIPSIDRIRAYKMAMEAARRGLPIGELIVYRTTGHLHITLAPHGGTKEFLWAEKEGGPYHPWNEGAFRG